MAGDENFRILLSMLSGTLVFISLSWVTALCTSKRVIEIKKERNKKIGLDEKTKYKKPKHLSNEKLMSW